MRIETGIVPSLPFACRRRYFGTKLEMMRSEAGIKIPYLDPDTAPRRAT